MFILRDPFARTEVHREEVRTIGECCAWCGGASRDRHGNRRLFRYRIEHDGGRREELRHLFCSISCMRSHQP